MNKFYLDTSIWRDYYENRADMFRPIGEWALTFLKNCIKNEDLILYSESVIEELKIKYSDEEIVKILNIINKRDSLVKVNICENQLREAAILCKQRSIAFGDALHAVLARDNKAVLITRDKHFLELLDIADVKKPEDLI